MEIGLINERHTAMVTQFEAETIRLEKKHRTEISNREEQREELVKELQEKETSNGEVADEEADEGADEEVDEEALKALPAACLENVM